MSLPSLQAGLLDRDRDQVERLAVAGQVRREAALVAEAGGQAALLQHRLQRVVDAGALHQRLGVRRRADRGDHELLHVDVAVRVRAAVEDVHHRHRQDVRVRAADVAEQRQAGAVRGRLGDRQADAEDGVRAELGLVRGAVEVEQGLVDQPLLVDVVPDDLLVDVLQDRGDRLLDTLAAVPGLVAVAQFDGLELAGGRARGHGRPGDGVVVEQNLDLDSGVAARVEDLAGADGLDGGHIDSQVLDDESVPSLASRPAAQWTASALTIASAGTSRVSNTPLGARKTSRLPESTPSKTSTAVRRPTGLSSDGARCTCVRRPGRKPSRRIAGRAAQLVPCQSR